MILCILSQNLNFLYLILSIGKTQWKKASFKVNSEEGTWSSNIDYDGGNLAHRPSVKGGYFPVPPVDSLMDIRNAMCIALEEQGVDVEVHHHEVGGAGQCEIGTKFNSLIKELIGIRS